MKKVSFSKLVSGMLAGKDSTLPQMWRPTDQPYPRLMDMDPVALGLAGQGGIYAVWHLGVRPQWLRVGAAANLGAALSQLVQMPWIEAHRDNQGVFVAWCCPSHNQSAGFVRYLVETLAPAFQSAPFSGDQALDSSAPAIVCQLPPGTQI